MYERYESRLVTVLSNGDIAFLVCTDCGVPVLDRKKHDKFHEEFSYVASNAYMLDRIG